MTGRFFRSFQCEFDHTKNNPHRLIKEEPKIELYRWKQSPGIDGIFKKYGIFRSRYSRMDLVKFFGRQPL